jgi:hypothetical protein
MSSADSNNVLSNPEIGGEKNRRKKKEKNQGSRAARSFWMKTVH